MPPSEGRARKARPEPRRPAPRAGPPLGGPLARIGAVIAQVPRGKVLTYGAAAALAGFPRSGRLTVWALHRADGLPWHRIVAAGGRIALAGGDGAVQRGRLAREGVTFRAGRVRMELHEWRGRPRRAPPPRRRSR